MRGATSVHLGIEGCMDIKIYLYVIAMTLPIYLAVRYSSRGIVLGGLVIWGLVLAANLINPQTLGLGWVYSILWIAFGWPIGIAYSALTSAFILLLWRMLSGRTP